MSAEIDRAKIAVAFKMSANDVNQPEFWSPGKMSATSRHYSFSQEEKPYHPKRRYSDKFPPGLAAHGFRRKAARFANRANPGKIVLPTKFLLGGNISDPLNLNSLCDEEINRSLNEFTPVSSPMPIPGHRLENKVPIIHPANIHDPLNLENSDEDAKVLMASLPKNMKSRKRKHSHKKHPKTTEKPEGRDNGAVDSALMNPLSIQIEPAGADVFPCPSSRDGNKNVGEFSGKKVIDKIVSPVIPQTSPKWKRKRTNSESRPEVGEVALAPINERERSGRNDKAAAAVRSKSKRNSTALPDFKRKDSRFVHGNYSTFRGYRAPAVEDNRVKMFTREMFEGKDVLDIGCNVGHLAIDVAQRFAPRSVTGIDVDGKLIEAAKKNLRFYMSRDVDARFPVSLKIMHGPLAAHPLLELKGSRVEGKFPHNVSFGKANYFLDCGDPMQPARSQYDVILALGLTKWIHLNYGDAGLKSCFRRMFQQLRPGGILILEAQKWGSYRKKKKLTECTFKIYKSLQFRPDQFREFLTSKEIGFSSCRFLNVPSNKPKGSWSTVHIFTKDNYRRTGVTLASAIPPAAESRDLRVARLPAPPPPPPPISTSMDTAESPCSWHDAGSAKFDIGSSPFTACSTCEDSCSGGDPGTPWAEGTSSPAGRDAATAAAASCSRAGEEGDQTETGKDGEGAVTLPKTNRY